MNERTAGTRLLGGRYELRHVLGFGGMGEIRDGWDTRLGRAVAVKLLHPTLSHQADVRERFSVEARVAAGLSHPNIVRVYDFGAEAGAPFIVMERLAGDTLGDQIALGPLPESQVRAALRDVLSALTAAHAAGMLHRDIKPGNILLAPSGGVKVADFGIVKAPGSVHTTTGQIVGTLAYLSPDRLAGVPASVADDLYAVGVVGYEALTGCKPFPQEDIVPLARAIAEDDPPRLTDLRPGVDPVLADVIERAMSRNPLHRFGSADEMRAALDGAAPRYLPAAPVLPAPASTRKRPARTRALVGSAALLSAMAAAVLAFAPGPSTAPLPGTPDPVSVEAPVATQITATAVPPPAPPPSPTVVYQVTQQEPIVTAGGNVPIIYDGGAHPPKVNGDNGHGPQKPKGNGKGKGKPK